MRQRSIRLAVLLAIVLFGVTPPTAEADLWHGEIIYYNDAYHSVYVGRFIRFCNNYEFRDGTVTPYSSEEQFNCDPEW